MRAHWKRWAATVATGALLVSGGIAFTGSAHAANPVATGSAATQILPSVVAAQAISTAATPITTAAKPVAKRSVTLKNPTGAPPAGSPSVTSVAIVQDVVAKKVKVTAKFTSPPKASGKDYLFVYLGTWNGNTCDVASGVGLLARGTADHGATLLPSTGVTSSAKVSGSTLTLTASGNSRLGSANWQCAYAFTADPVPATAVIFQNLDAQSLKVGYVKKAKLKSSVTSSVAVKSGKTGKVKVSVKNTGTATAKKVKVTFTGSKLKYSKKSVSLGSIAPGKKKSVTVRVKLSGNSTRTGKAAATASGKLRSANNFKVLRFKKTTIPKSLSGKYFWGWKTNYSKGWDNTAVMFVNKKWAYLGVPGKGVPKCSSKVKKCKKYSYNAKTGKVKIGKKTGKATSKALTLGKQKYAPLHIPKKGTKLNVALIHKDFNGCFGGPFCSTWTESLMLGKNGRFVRSKSVLAGFGVPGVSQTWYNNAGPSERGTYKVLSRGRIHFTYQSGKKVVRTIGIEQNVSEKPAPQTEGLFVGGVNFYPK